MGVKVLKKWTETAGPAHYLHGIWGKYIIFKNLHRYLRLSIRRQWTSCLKIKDVSEHMSKCVDGKYCVIIIRCALWIVKESLDFCFWRRRTIIAWMMFGCIKIDLLVWFFFYFLEANNAVSNHCPVICPVFLQTILPRLPPCPFSPITATVHLPQLWSLSSQQSWEHSLCSPPPPTCCMLWQRRVLAASVEDVRMPPLRRSLLLLSVSHSRAIVLVNEKKRMNSWKKRYIGQINKHNRTDRCKVAVI